MSINLSLDTLRHFIYLEGDTVYGRDGGLAFARRVAYIRAADEDERDWIAERHPETVAAVLLYMRAHWAFEWMRDLVKRAEAGLDLGGELDLLAAAPAYPPVSASVHVAIVSADAEVAA